MIDESQQQGVELCSPKPIGRVSYSTPKASLLDGPRPAAVGHGVVRLRFAFGLAHRSSRARFVAAFLRVRFDGGAVAADELWIEPAQREHTTAVSVLDSGGLGWLIGDPMRTDAIPTACATHAVVQIPLREEALSGTMRVDATAVVPTVTGLRRVHASSAQARRFTVRLPHGWSAQAAPRAEEPAPPPSFPPPAVRLCVAADIERFSRFSSPEAGRAQRRFVDLLANARANAGLAEADVALQESGDGQLAVLPPGVDESFVLPRLVEGLRIAAREINADLSEHARLRFRVALYRGHVLPGANGWVGNAPIAVHRLLDSAPLRRALAGSSGADFALIVPDLLYREIIEHHYGTLDPAGFVEADVTVPEKNFAEWAWIHVPR